EFFSSRGDQKVTVRELTLRIPPPPDEPIGGSEICRADKPQVWIADLPTPWASHFVGRDQELDDLDKAWTNESCRVVTVIGGWGSGKSTLIRRWLSRMRDDHYRGAEFVLGWSFRGQGTDGHGGGDGFLQRALTWLDVPNPDYGLDDLKVIRF